MSTLAGQAVSGQHRRPVLARAAVLVDQNGQQALSPDLLALAARRARYAPGDDPLEVVLVTRTRLDARYVRAPGLLVVGVVAEEDEHDAPAGAPAPASANELPVLVAVAGARDAITEGELVIVDAARGRVLVAPDAVAIARAQAEPEKPRLLLGAAHTPAQTRSGRLLAVWAALGTDDPERDLAAALAAGADGLLVPAKTMSALLGENSGNDDAADNSPFALPPPPPDALLAIVDAIGGGALALQTPTWDALDPAHLTLLGARCALRWLLDPDDLPLSPNDLRAELAALAAGEEDQGRFAHPPRLAALLRSDHGGASAAAFLVELAAAGFDEAILLVEAGQKAQVNALWGHLPVYVWLKGSGSGDRDSDDLLDTVEQAVHQGAAGVIVRPDQVSDAKNRIREVE